MSELNVTAAPLQPLDTSKEGTALPVKEKTKPAVPSRLAQTEQEKKPKSVTSTDLDYSIDREDQALHLKVKGADGAVVRELVFERIDLSLLDTKKLKGIFVDGTS